MSKLAYDTLIDQIRNSILAYEDVAFKSVSLVEWDEWTQSQESPMPKSMANNGFCVYPAEIIDPESGTYESESVTDSVLNISVEFALEGTHDKYLSVLGDCQEAIAQLRSISYAEFKLNFVKPLFNIGTFKDTVRVVFTGIQFLIRNE